jgi:hypothetical protein
MYTKKFLGVTHQMKDTIRTFVGAIILSCWDVTADVTYVARNLQA